ncbi:MAG: acriflavine resistance protein B [Planctomycetes bacterium]|nr:acriflavine resistance protein B [Planctomycetota bacterium]
MEERKTQARSPGLIARSTGPIETWVKFALERRLVVFLFAILLVGWSLRVSPFQWDLGAWAFLKRDRLAVDALPNLGENQQIVYIDWPGRSPQDVEDQVTYPLTVALLGVPGVRTIRSFSMFGFASVYVIFEEDVEFYWSRSRILEKLSSLPADTLPSGVKPALGPDATGLGQVYWYTLEGRSPEGDVVGGWDLHELRSVQDWTVRYALAATEGISEVASIGGYVQEYQIDVDPAAMRAHGVPLTDIVRAVRHSNLDVGARSVEINRVEYMIRALGFVSKLEDLERTVVRVSDNVPIYVKDVAHVSLGPAQRRGALDKEGTEAVGGVAVVRYGANPMEAIQNLKEKIRTIEQGLPARPVFDRTLVEKSRIADFARENGIEDIAQRRELSSEDAWVVWLRTHAREHWPEWVELSQVTIVPFYDRTQLIVETLATLEDALIAEVLVTALVVLLMLLHLPSSILIGGLLPLSVGATFCLMKLTGIEANIVALAGIAIAIGTMVDMAIVITENILRRLQEAPPEESKLDVVREATIEVAGAIITSVATTIIAFLPVFSLTAAEGKLFRPLAYTKTFALISSLVLALTLLPPACSLIFGRKRGAPRNLRRGLHAVLALIAGLFGFFLAPPIGLALLAWSAYIFFAPRLGLLVRGGIGTLLHMACAMFILFLLSRRWMPLGPTSELNDNIAFVGLICGVVLVSFLFFRWSYPWLLALALRRKMSALALPLLLCVSGACAWLGFARVFAPLAPVLKTTSLWNSAVATFPGLGQEFLPDFDEGSFLFMPSTMAHGSLGEAFEVLSFQDRAIAAIPEVDSVVGKIGRADSALDPAPIGMMETIIRYKNEYGTGEDGKPKRLWRDHIRSPDDIWQAVLAAAAVPGTTSAPKLYPIEGRIVMLQSGMRAPMGIKVKGPDLKTIEAFGLDLERHLKEAPGIASDTVQADRIVGKPYLEIDLDRRALARYGLHISNVQEVIEVGVGGKRLTTTVEGRERYPVRVRYARESRDDLESLGRIAIPTDSGAQIPLSQLATIRFVRGPQVLKSEDTSPVGYVIFDALEGLAESGVVADCRAYLQAKIDRGELSVPPGVSFEFAGSYENEQHARQTLRVVVPLSLALIFIVLYLQFRSSVTAAIVFSGVAVAWSGGFLLLWLYGQDWMGDWNLFGHSMKELFGVQKTNLSVGVWVGFLALFGIATDDGVVLATYLRQSFRESRPDSVEAIRRATLAAGKRRIRPCLMTSASTLLALLPILTSDQRGSELLIPMALPSFGGMLIALSTILVVPVLFCWSEELRLTVFRPYPRQ